jgi:hypothetical protein
VGRVPDSSAGRREVERGVMSEYIYLFSSDFMFSSDLVNPKNYIGFLSYFTILCGLNEMKTIQMPNVLGIQYSLFFKTSFLLICKGFFCIVIAP